MRKRLRRLRAFIANIFAPPPGVDEHSEDEKKKLIVEAMLHGRSCCG